MTNPHRPCEIVVRDFLMMLFARYRNEHLRFMLLSPIVSEYTLSLLISAFLLLFYLETFSALFNYGITNITHTVNRNEASYVEMSKKKMSLMCKGLLVIKGVLQ